MVTRSQAPPAPPPVTLREQVSPELALVDPELRRQLVERAVDPPAWTTVAVASPRPLPAHGPRGARVRPRSAPASLAPLVLPTVALSIAFVLGALVFPMHGSQTNTRNLTAQNGRAQNVSVEPPSSRVASAGIPEPGSGAFLPLNAGPSRAPAATQRQAAPGIGTRSLVWAPAAGAASYEVALYRGNVRAFDAFTREPAIGISVRLHGGDGSKSVAAGAYEWYVWPIRAGHRSAAAVVRSPLVLTAP
jgi:hypothetical protein